MRLNVQTTHNNKEFFDMFPVGSKIKIEDWSQDHFLIVAGQNTFYSSNFIAVDETGRKNVNYLKAAPWCRIDNEIYEVDKNQYYMFPENNQINLSKA